ncbi:MAG: hypothetical protein AB1778_09390 [Candidatus Bipolaricaulota bacterium]
MQKKGKRLVASLIGLLVGGALIGVGVWVWLDGNTAFGAAAVVIGAIILIGWARSATMLRRGANRS